MKQDDGKLRYDLLPTTAVAEMVDVLTQGAKKYTDNGWKKVLELEGGRDRYIAAMLRHAFALLGGEMNDRESLLHHGAHIMCNAAFIIEFDKVDEE